MSGAHTAVSTDTMGLRRRQRLRLLRLALVLQWESGTLSHLPLRGVGDLATHVDLLAHPESYTALTATRMAGVIAG